MIYLMDSAIHSLNNWDLDFESDSPRLPQPHHYVRVAVHIGSYINDMSQCRRLED